MSFRGQSLAMGAAATSVAGLTVAKATRDTLFVATFPVAWLPYALIVTGLASALCVSLYTKLSARASPRRVAPAFPALFAVLIAVLAIALARGKSPVLVGVKLALGASLMQLPWRAEVVTSTQLLACSTCISSSTFATKP